MEATFTCNHTLEPFAFTFCHQPSEELVIHFFIEIAHITTGQEDKVPINAYPRGEEGPMAERKR
jgi:hypothetical protein